jgi:PhnB protein
LLAVRWLLTYDAAALLRWTNHEQEQFIMTTKPVPEGCHAVTPYLTVPDAQREVEFLVTAFGAVERASIRRPNGGVMHAQVVIGDSIWMIGEPPDPSQCMPMTLYHYVTDCDAAWTRAVAAGGEVINEPMDMFYGDRTGAVKDPGGNAWWIATHKEMLTTEQIQERATVFFQQQHK